MKARLIAGLLLVALAIGVWALWPRGEPDTTPSTTVVAVENTRAQSGISISTSDSTTTTGAVESHVVTTVEEAEEILRELWFGWFEGIYNEDEERIREVVGSQAALDDARAQFGVMEFVSEPDATAITFGDTEILRSDSQCLAVWAGVEASFRAGSTEGVHVLRDRGDAWVFAGYWLYKQDLWEGDCESQLDSF